MRRGLLLFLSIQPFSKIVHAAIDVNNATTLLIPPCCDPALQPGPDTCQSGYICCPDGSWGCELTDKPGVYDCSGVELAKPTPGITCPPTSPPTAEKCCVEEDKPTCSKASCCDDGIWTCPAQDGSFLCNGQVSFNSPTGKVCKQCCINHERTRCPIGDWACCSNGSLICPDSTTGTYMCGVVPVKQTLGSFCCCDPSSDRKSVV